jgi:predicted DNA-binding helix-hairpin-helix protein
LKEIVEKSISPELECFLKENEFSSIEVLLTIENEDLLQMPGFGWRMMKEVLLLRKVH